MVVRPLRDDPLGVRLLLFSRPGAYEGAGIAGVGPAVDGEGDGPEGDIGGGAPGGAPGDGPGGAEVYADLEAAYREAALQAVVYRQWLMRNKSPLLHAPAA